VPKRAKEKSCTPVRRCAGGYAKRV
jgi:hypothetical protein